MFARNGVFEEQFDKVYGIKGTEIEAETLKKVSTVIIKLGEKYVRIVERREGGKTKSAHVTYLGDTFNFKNYLEAEMKAAKILGGKTEGVTWLHSQKDTHSEQQKPSLRQSFLRSLIRRPLRES